MLLPLWPAFWLFHFVARHLGHLARGLVAAWQFREIRQLLYGLPALLLAVTVLGLGAAATIKRHTLPDRYRDDALQAFHLEQYEVARLYLERLVDLEGPTNEALYDLALTVDRLDEHPRAIALMQRVAPPESVGFARAHLWLARHLLIDKKTFEDSETLKVAFTHLTRAAQASPYSYQVQLDLAQYYINIRRPRTAAVHLARAAEGLPYTYYDLALLYAALKRFDLAKEATRRAAIYYRAKVGREPLDHDARLRWASTLINMGEIQSAVRILQEGLSLDREGPFARALAGAYVSQYDKHLASIDPDPAAQLGRLQLALGFLSDFQPALQRLIHFGEDPKTLQDPEQAKLAREVLETLLAKGQLPAVAHFTLGVQARDRQDLDTAAFHLGRAFKLEPKLGDVGNNLAWVLAIGNPPDLNRAHRVINSVIDQWPKDPEYRDTRGQIRLKMHQYSDALDDLQLAIRAFPDRPSVHEALATTYDKLGIKQLAERHKSLARKIRKNTGLE